MAQKEYLKMADVTFGEPVTENNGCIFGRDFVAGFHFKSTKHPAKTEHYVSHAINSHDELVAEVERLRGALTSSRLALSNAAMNMKWFDISKAQEILREVNAIDKLISAIGTSDAKI